MVNKILSLYKQAYTGLPREIWLLSLILLINRAGTMVMIFFVLYLTNVFDFSNQTAGFIISVSAIGGILGALVGGYCSDRFGSIRSQILFLFLISIQFFLMLLADSLLEIAAGLFVLMFLGEAVRPGLHAACLEFSDAKNQKRAMGLLRLAVNIGMAIGPVIGGVLAQFELWSWLFILDGASCLMAAGMLLILFGWANPSKCDEEQPNLSLSQPSHGSPWRDPQMLRFGFFYLMILIVFIQFSSTFVKFLQDAHGLTESQIGLLSSINPILIVLVEMAIIKAIENRSTIRTIAVGSLLICLGFGSLAFAPNTFFCAICLIVLTLGEILAFPMTAAFAAEQSNDKNRGQYMGFITVIFSIAMIIGPAAGLTLYDFDRNLPWYVTLVIGGISFVALWNMRPADEECPVVQGKLADLG